MEDIKKIDGSNSVRFVNAQHAHFHSRAYEMVNEFGFAKVNVNAELATEYKSNIDAEIELNNEARAYIETPQLAAADSERDSITVYLFGAIRTAALSPIAQVREPAEALLLITKPYTGLQGEARDRQTTKTDGLILDLMKPENAARIAALGQTQIITLLDEANKKYQQIKDGLTNLKAAEDLEASKVVRPRTDANYLRITELIFATYLLGDAAIRAEIAPLIDRLNQFIAEQKTAHKQSQAQKGKKSDDNNNENPETVETH